MPDVAPPAEHLRQAVDKLGGQNATARFLGISQPSVWRWLKKGQPLPPEFVLAVEGATGISKHDLRPDIYPRDATPPAAGKMEPVR